jgi:hypothetical protein
MNQQRLSKLERLANSKKILEIPETQEGRKKLIQQLNEKERYLLNEVERIEKARFFLEGLPYAVVSTSISESHEAREQSPVPPAEPVSESITEPGDIPAQKPTPRRLRV